MARRTSPLWQEQWLVPVIWAGLCLLLLMPLVVTPTTLFPFIVGKAIYTRALIEVIVALWVILAIASPKFRPGPSWILTIFAGYVAINLLAALFGQSLNHSFWGDYRRMGGVFDLTHWIALLVVLISMVKTTSHWQRLLNLNLGISLALALLGLSQHFGVTTISRIFWYFEAKERLDITLGNPTYVGAYMMVNALVAAAFLAQSFQLRGNKDVVHRKQRHRRQPKQEMDYSLIVGRTFWALVIVLNLWVMLLSGTRGAVVGMGLAGLAGGVVYAFFGSRRQIRITAAIGTGLLLLLILGFPLLRTTTAYKEIADQNVTLERLRNAGLSEQRSLTNRLVTTRIGFEAFTAFPILGWGPENFALAFQRHQKRGDFGTPFLSDLAHNRVLNELTTTGVVGLLAYLLLWGRMGQIIYRRIRAHPEQDLFTTLIGTALFAYFVQNLFLFDVHATYLQVFLLIGWLAHAEIHLETDATVQAIATPTSKDPSTPPDAPKRQFAAVQWSSLKGLVIGPIRRVDRAAQHPELLHWAGGLSLLLIVSLSLYFTALRPFQAAELFPTQVSGSDERVVWEEFWNNARKSFDMFPPLSTIPRQVLLNTFVNNWESVSTLGVDNIAANVERERTLALGIAPDDPSLHLALGNLYQKAASTHPRYLEQSRIHADAVLSLAPGMLEGGLLIIRQEIMEGNYATAEDLIEKYDIGLEYEFRRKFTDLGNFAIYHRCEVAIREMYTEDGVDLTPKYTIDSLAAGSTSLVNELGGTLPVEEAIYKHCGEDRSRDWWITQWLSQW